MFHGKIYIFLTLTLDYPTFYFQDDDDDDVHKWNYKLSKMTETKDGIRFPMSYFISILHVIILSAWMDIVSL